MAAPTNTSFLTAMELGSLPADATQTVDDAGTTYTVYYKFTAPTDAVVIGAWAFGDLTTYEPTLTPYEGPAASPTQILGISAANVPLQMPVAAGTEYFLKIQPNGGNPSPAVLTLNVQVAPQGTVPIGAFAVNDAAAGFPLGYFSSLANYTTLRFQKDFPAGEAGDTSLNGYVLVHNVDTHELALYRPTTTDLDPVMQTPSGGGTISIRLCQGLNTFYAGMSANPPLFRTVTTAGIVSGSTPIAGSTSMGALAANNDGTLLYHAALGTAAAVAVWDIVNVTALANLVAGVANYSIPDLLVLTDGTVIIGYSKQTATRDYFVRAYSAAGVLLRAFAIGQWETSEDRLAYAIDDPNSFWVMHHPVGADDGKITMLNIKVSDGSTLATRLTAGYTNGGYDLPATATPAARFGPSSSCPFWITRSVQAPATTTFTMRRQRRFLLPSSPDNKRIQIPTIELLMRTGIGLTPDAWGTDANTPQGANPQVMTRISKDGGMTWSPERWVSAGKIGQYLARVRLLRATGAYRNAVFEVTVSDPVSWQMIAAMGEPVEGSS